MNEIRPIPGSYGLPVLGFLLQSYKFIKQGWRNFFAGREADLGSSVFRAAAGVKAITILDQQGIESIFDSSKVEKMYGFGPLKPPHARVGNIVPTVFTNGEEHRRQKQWLMSLQEQSLPEIFQVFEKVAAPRFENWTKEAGRFDWGTGIDDLYADFLFEYFLGTKADPRDVAIWGYGLLPRNPFRLPGQGDKPVVEALERLLAVIQSAPKWKAIADDAKRIAGLDELDAAKQLLFYLGFNAYTGLGSVTRSLIGELDNHPELAAWVSEELDAVSAQRGYSGGVQDPSLLKATPRLGSALREALRLHQPAPFAYGKALKDFVIESRSGRFQVKTGEVIAAVLGYAHRDPAVFTNPNDFNPKRFEIASNMEGLIWAHGRESSVPGPDNKMCAGRDIVYLAILQFFIKLLSGYRYQLALRPFEWSDVHLQPANRPVTPVVFIDFKARI